MKYLVFLLVLLIFLPDLFATPQVIYGDDNREDVISSGDRLFVDLSRSTAAMMKPENLHDKGEGIVEVEGISLEQRGICPSEPFSQQLTAADCSGFLVGSKWLVTAGHCIQRRSDCSYYKWVFDYKISHQLNNNITVKKENIYSCKRVITQELNARTANDFALIELDREVTDRAPLSYRKIGKPQVDDELVVIGHPTGLPTKIAAGGSIRNLEESFFVASVDTYQGNSGSAVFNQDSGLVEGILVRGEQDWTYNVLKGCKESYRCQEDKCRGEDVVYITNIKELLAKQIK